MSSSILAALKHKVAILHPYRQAIPAVGVIAIASLSLFAPEVFALNSSDQVEELQTLTHEVSKISKNACWILGTASAAVGTLWTIAAQNLKVFAGTAAVTLLAFKAPAFFTSAMVI